MAQPPIVKSLDAERDLTELFDYVAQDSGVERAELILRRLDETLTNLAVWPRSGRVSPQLDGSPRVFSVGLGSLSTNRGQAEAVSLSGELLMAVAIFRRSFACRGDAHSPPS